MDFQIMLVLFSPCGAKKEPAFKNRTYAKAMIACGSMVRYFFCRSFFAPPGKK